VADTDITLVQLKVELGNVKTYLRAADYAQARLELACARATLAGLAARQSDAGTAVEYRPLVDDLLKAIDAAEAAAAGASSGDGGCAIVCLGNPE